jgi:hypothetical protein
MRTWSRSRSERWVKTEKADRRSRLSPKNSARTGSRPVEGKNVDEAAAHRELAALLDGLGALVAGVARARG